MLGRTCGTVTTLSSSLHRAPARHSPTYCPSWPTSDHSPLVKEWVSVVATTVEATLHSYSQHCWFWWRPVGKPGVLIFRQRGYCPGPAPNHHWGTVYIVSVQLFAVNLPLTLQTAVLLDIQHAAVLLFANYVLKMQVYCRQLYVLRQEYTLCYVQCTCCISLFLLCRCCCTYAQVESEVRS